MPCRDVLLVGVSSSIGLAVASELVLLGYRVLGTFRTMSAELQRTSVQLGDQLELFQVDFSEQSAEARLEAFCKARLESLVGVIHLPSAKLLIAPIRKTEIADIIDDIFIQLRSIHPIMKGIHKRLVSEPGFRVIGVSSAVLIGEMAKGFSQYAIAKAVTDTYLKAVQSEYAQFGTEVSIIYPRMFKSPLLSEVPGSIVDIILSGKDYSPSVTNEFEHAVHRVVEKFR